jgi:hypothetical protein|nr:MAG: hypothetical protein [Bacteriophage sp.]
MENKAKAGIIEILDNNSKIIGYIAVDAQTAADVVGTIGESITKLSNDNITINLNTADLDDDKMSVARRLLNKCSRLYNDMIDENKV